MKYAVLNAFLLINVADAFAQGVVIKNNAVDFRSSISYGQIDENIDFSKVGATIIVPLSYKNSSNRILKLVWESIRIDFGNTVFDMPWQKIVDIQPEKNCWLCIVREIAIFDIPLNGSLEHETLFARTHFKGENFTRSSLKWGDFLDAFKIAKKLEITVNSAVINRELNGSSKLEFLLTSCRVDHEKWSEILRNFIDTHGKLPGRITMDCH